MAPVAIVTGGTRGIGAAISGRLRAAGFTVVASYLNNEQAAAELAASTGAIVKCWDVADIAACQDAVAMVEAAIGPVAVLVNNAGITRDASFRKMTLSQWRDVLAVNLGGCFNMVHSVWPGMAERRYGRIVNLGSINGQAGQFGQVNYSAAKAGLHGFTKACALEGGKAGITVNLVAPGYTETDMLAAMPEAALEKTKTAIPVGRLGLPEDIARAVEFFCMKESGFATGGVLSVNGGQHMF
ncbi:MAG TPA: acetoacetyl-CoA reductase [Allosphingosinicella sp.]|jgi:acetoacetyl-CoA reductase